MRSDCSSWWSVKYSSGKKSILFLFINVIYYYRYFLSNPILLVSFTLAEYPPHPRRAACSLPITGRLKHLGARPAQLYTCHCPAVCRVLQMAIPTAEWADRQLHPRGNGYGIIRKHCIRISYNKNSVKPLPQVQPLPHVQGDLVYLFVSLFGVGGVLFWVSVLSPTTCEQKCQNAITAAVLAVFVLGLQWNILKIPFQNSLLYD